jgi:ABC-type branched-subunit amino acid transport system permease subunit
VLRKPSALNLLFRQPALASGELGFLVAIAVGVAFLLSGPLWLSPYALGATRDAVIFAVFALSFDFLWGKSNTLTLGHATFFGLGAYGLAITGTKLGWSSLAGIATGVGIAGAFALLVGYFLIFAGVRLHFLAIISIAVLLIVAQVAVSWTSLTGGDVGILGVPGLKFSFLGHTLDLTADRASYFFAVGMAVAVLLILWLACRGNYGKLLAAVGMNELRAKTFGYNTSLHLLIVFVVSAMIAALSGAVFAAVSGVVAPDLFSPLLSLEVALWVAIGGRGTLLGPVIATVVLTRLHQEVSSYSTSLWPLILGFLFLALILFLPGGLRQFGDLFKVGVGRLRRVAMKVSQ